MIFQPTDVETTIRKTVFFPSTPAEARTILGQERKFRLDWIDVTYSGPQEDADDVVFEFWGTHLTEDLMPRGPVVELTNATIDPTIHRDLRARLVAATLQHLELI